MARDLRSSNIVDLEVRQSALGTELIPCELNGRDVYLTANQIGALGGGSGITVSDADPGATGPGSGWLLIDGSGNSLALFVRNNADDGWLSDGALPLGALLSSVEMADDLDFTGQQARILVIPTADSFGFVTVFQVKFEGDVFPRSVMMSDGTHYIGDGTYNPTLDPDTGEWAGYTPLGTHGLLVNGGLSTIRLGSTNPDRLGYLEINGMVFVAHPSVDTPDRSVGMTVPFDLLGQRPDPAMPGEAYVRFFARNAEVTPGNDRTEPAVIDDQGVATPLLRLFSTLPADIDIPPGGLVVAFDSTNGAASFDLKGKTDDGTVVAGSLPLA